MVAPAESLLSELETGADSNCHLLYKKFKYIPKGVASTSRKKTEEMSKSDSPAAASVPPADVEPPGDELASTMKSPYVGEATTTSDMGKGVERLRSTSPLPPVSRDKPAYMIRWNRFEEQVCNAFAELFCSDHFVDVTLACDGEMMKAHKIVLAMSSPFFRRIFQETPCKHPVVIIKGMTPKTLRNILQYIYLGEVTLNKNEINNFMDAADYLSICGVFANLYSCDISTTASHEDNDNNDNDMEQDFEKPPSSDGGGQQGGCGASESDGRDPAVFRDDSQSEQEDKESTVPTQSNVIKYHGIKSRWTRRYSNTSSYHGTPTISSPVQSEHKRSASAGEVETSLEQGNHHPHHRDTPSEVDRIKPPMSREIPENLSEMEVSTPTLEEDRGEERSCVSDDPDSSRDRRIIQRAYPRYYRSTYEDGSDHSVDEVKSQPSYTPTSIHHSLPAARSSRASPYSIGAKDLSHPLQVSVDTHSNPPPLYGGPSSTSSASGGGVIESAVRVKSHSGFTVYSSPQSLPSQRSIFRTQSESEFPITSSPMSLIAPPIREERSVLKRQFSSGSSTSSSQSVFRQHHHLSHSHTLSHHQHQHPSSRHQHHDSEHQVHHHPPHSRPHLPLLSTQGPWPFPDHHHQRLRGPPNLPEESSREIDDIRYRSNSLERERDFPNFGGVKDFFSHASQLRNVAGFGGKSHSFPTATDLSVSSAAQQYSLGFMPQLKSPPSSSSTATRPKTKAIRSSQVPQSARYTAAEVDQMVDAVANYPGNIVPCTLCQKFVKRERLRAHIHECHLLSGEKIICPHCGIALKSKGSFRVHIWRHKRGALPTRSTMTDFGRDRPPSPQTGPASH